MNGEPEPADGPDKLDAAVRGVWFVWLGLINGMVIVTAVAAAFVATQGPVAADVEMPLVVTCLATIPVGLVGAFIVVPRMPLAPGSPAGGANEPFPGFGAYVSQFFIRAGLLEGPATLCAVGLIVTGNWGLLVAIAVMLVALASVRPSRAKAEAFIEAARERVREIE